MKGPLQIHAIVLALLLGNAMAQTPHELYVLPPGEESWILGSPYLKVGTSAAERLEVDTAYCGWFKKTYTGSTTVPEQDAWIWLGSQGKDRIGVLGMKEEKADWPGENPTPINLKTRFDAIAAAGGRKRLFFYANDGTWQTTPPVDVDKSRCEYNFAAIIYQRTKGNGDGFSWYGVNTNPAGDSSNATRDYGICKGIVKNVLDTAGKMQFNSMNCPNNVAPYAANPNGSYWDGGTKDQAVAATNFYNAFKEVEGQTVKKCWNMPFQKRPGGLWEFDAYYLCKDDLENNPHTDFNSTATRGCGVTGANAGNVGGFYPGFGYYAGVTGGQSNGRDNPTRTGADVQFNGDRVDVKPAYKWCFDRGWSGQITNNVIGDLSDKTTRDALDVEMRRVCGANARQHPTVSTGSGLISQAVDAHDVNNPNGYGAAINVKGGHLCFESQDAEFTYEPGQEFFFRGDDDIWVFVSNYLVVDLGGTHMPAPGYLKMDTLRVPEAARIKDRQYGQQGQLVEGQKYPIKIFFCDRRGSGSNVRISTNMYFSQKTGLRLKEGSAKTLGDVCLDISGGGSCEAAAGEAGKKEQCGTDLKNKLQYYLARRDGITDKQMLDKTMLVCREEGTLLKCYGESIVIDFENGQVKVGGAAEGLVGTYTIYAELKDNIVDPKPAPLNLGTVSGRTYTQVVWGNIVNSESKATIKYIPFKPDVDGKVGMEAVASKLVPVGFAQGAWVKAGGGISDSSKTDARFEVNVEVSAGVSVRLASGFRDASVPGSHLKAYSDSLGTEEVDFNSEFTIPASGLLVLWFTGVFEADTTATYDINSRAGYDPFAIKVYQPKIEFLNASDAIIPVAERYGSEPSKGGDATNRGIYVAVSSSRKIAAYDPTVSPMTICTTCNFEPRDVRIETTVIEMSEETTYKANDVIEFSDKKLVNGIGSFVFSGVIPVEKKNDSIAFFMVGGPSRDAGTLAKWDSLQFIEPPIPVPNFAYIFDKNGDGKGDSIVVIYDRKFPHNEAGMPDSLPNKLIVVWEPGDTLSFGLGQLNEGGEYNNAGIDPVANWEYWQQYLRRGSCEDDKACSDTIIISLPAEGHEAFSSEIKTAAYGGENVFSWSTFVTKDGVAGRTQKFERKITDKIPPIIVKAEYQGDRDTKCGNAADNRCFDRLTLEFSEKVRMAEGVVSLDKVKEAFAYYLNADTTTSEFKVYEEDKSLAYMVMWGKKRDYPDYNGDSIVQLTYRQYKTDSDNSYTPVPNDSVRFLEGSRNLGTSVDPTGHAFQDLEGNYPNPMEIGRKVEGKGRLNTDRYLIADVDVNDKELKKLKDKMRDIFGYPGEGGFAEKIESLFSPEKPMEFLPIPESCKDRNEVKECIRDMYPGTVGVVFWPSVKTTLSDSVYKNTTPDQIYFIANSFYHTNLGNFVVKSNEVRVRCDDPVFQIEGEEDCRNSNGLYLAWDLKDNKNRTVGTGAYVQVYNFRWEVENVEKAYRVPNKYPGSGNKIDMFGVRRVKGN
jgi:fibro-slime domain-containing protein